MLNTPIDVFLNKNIRMDTYSQTKNWSGKVKTGSVYLPGSYFSEAGSTMTGGFVINNNTSAELWTKNKRRYYLNDIVFDPRSERMFSITGYTHYYHDSYPYFGEYWFTKIYLNFVGYY